jgi:hypothetical protein
VGELVASGFRVAVRDVLLHGLPEILGHRAASRSSMRCLVGV